MSQFGEHRPWATPISWAWCMKAPCKASPRVPWSRQSCGGLRRPLCSYCGMAEMQVLTGSERRETPARRRSTQCIRASGNRLSANRPGRLRPARMSRRYDRRSQCLAIHLDNHEMRVQQAGSPFVLERFGLHDFKVVTGRHRFVRRKALCLHLILPQVCLAFSLWMSAFARSNAARSAMFSGSTQGRVTCQVILPSKGGAGNGPESHNE